MVKPASTRLETVPVVFEELEERVMVTPASKKKATEVPAVYEDVTDRKLVRAAYTFWKPGTATSIQKIDEKSGEIMC